MVPWPASRLRISSRAGLPAIHDHLVNVGAGRRVSEAAPVGQGRHQHGFSKDRPKVALVAKAHFLAKLRNRFVGGRQQGLGLGDAEVIEVGNEGLAGDVLEQTHEVRLADAQQI